jgi:hypothetical protein
MNKNAEELLFAIACHESHRGTYIKQVSGGALGIYQMEKQTYYDIFDNFLKYRDQLKADLFQAIGVDRMPDPNRMIWDMKLATAMCRIFFLRFSEPLPEHSNIHDIAIYWKKYYNTTLGKGTTEAFIKDYDKR